MKMFILLVLMLSVPVNADIGTSESAKVPKQPKMTTASTLPDLSGMVWIEDDLFVAVHDAKHDKVKPRVSLIQIPNSSEGVLWKTQKLKWPKPQGLSNDLESIARIPGEPQLLLVESGDDNSGFTRIFLADYDRYHRYRIQISDVVQWPTDIQNVEGTAVAKVGEQFIFIYAERAETDGTVDKNYKATTNIKWAELTLQPLSFGPFQSVEFTSLAPTGPHVRPVTALDVDKLGHLYVASAYDPDVDGGPFRSVVWKIGQATLDRDGKPTVNLYEPVRIATMDGLKAESVAIRENEGVKKEIFVGVDDEYYRGAMRILPLDD